MRILQLCTNFRPGGIQRHVLDLTDYLRGRGHQVTLAGDDGDWSGAAHDPGHLHLPFNTMAAAGGHSILRRTAAIPGIARRIRRLLHERRIELIHAHETAPAMAAGLARLGTGIPLVMTFHGSAPSREAGVARTGRRFADLVVSPSRTSLDALIARGLPRRMTRVIGLGIAPVPPVDAAEAAALRTALLAGRRGPLIFSLSRLDHQKGIDIMIDVARTIVARYPEAVFAVAGGGPLRHAVDGWAQAAGVGDRFRFLGPISTVAQHLAAADLFLLTSRWENLPISIVEAFRAGLPVIATDCGGVKELVDDSVGQLCAVGDVAGLARAITALIDDPLLRARKGAAARARSGEARFDPDAVHAEFERMYRDLSGRRHG